MSEKKDLAKLFGVEGMITPKGILNMTPEDMNNKTGSEMSTEAHELLNIVDSAVEANDIELLVRSLQALALRVDSMYIMASEIFKIIRK